MNVAVLLLIKQMLDLGFAAAQRDDVKLAKKYGLKFNELGWESMGREATTFSKHLADMLALKQGKHISHCHGLASVSHCICHPMLSHHMHTLLISLTCTLAQPDPRLC